MRMMSRVALLLGVASSLWFGVQTPTPVVVEGIYILYDHPEGPYMSAFVPCERGGHWAIAGGAAFESLKAAYKRTETNRFGELFVELEGTFRPISRQRFPDAEFDGYFTAAALRSFTVDQGRIDACQKAGRTKPANSPR